MSKRPPSGGTSEAAKRPAIEQGCGNGADSVANRQLEKWLQAEEAVFDNVDVVEVGPDSRKLVAKVAVEKDSVLIKLPTRCLIFVPPLFKTAETLPQEVEPQSDWWNAETVAYKHPIAGVTERQKVLADTIRRACKNTDDAHSKTVIDILKNDFQQGHSLFLWLELLVAKHDPRHPWAIFVQSLPREAPQPISWSTESRLLLQDTNLYKTNEATREKLQLVFDQIACPVIADHAVLFPGLATASQGLCVTIDDFLWARGVQISRSFPPTFCQVPWSTVGCMLPLVDMMNHPAIGIKSNTYLKVCASSGLTLRAATAVAEGDELLYDYGAKSNDQFMFSYGFCLADNPANTMPIRLTASRPAAQRGEDLVLQNYLVCCQRELFSRLKLPFEIRESQQQLLYSLGPVHVPPLEQGGDEVLQRLLYAVALLGAEAEDVELLVNASAEPCNAASGSTEEGGDSHRRPIAWAVQNPRNFPLPTPADARPTWAQAVVKFDPSSEDVEHLFSVVAAVAHPYQARLSEILTNSSSAAPHHQQLCATYIRGNLAIAVSALQALQQLRE